MYQTSKNSIHSTASPESGWFGANQLDLVIDKLCKENLNERDSWQMQAKIKGGLAILHTYHTWYEFKPINRYYN